MILLKNDVGRVIRICDQYQVGDDLNQKMLKRIRDLSKEISFVSKNFSFLNNIIFNFKKAFVFSMVAILALFGLINYRTNSYNYYLNQAYDSLNQLQAVLVEPNKPHSIFPSSDLGMNEYKEDNIVYLASKLVTSTEKAVKLVKRKKNLSSFWLAWVKVSELQVASLELLEDAARKVNKKPLVGSTLQGIEITKKDYQNLELLRDDFVLFNRHFQNFFKGSNYSFNKNTSQKV